MISVRVETPPQAAPVRTGPAAMERDGRNAPAFDDAMREQEAATPGSDAKASGAKDDVAAASVPDAAPVTAPPPVPLDALIAQVLPPPPPPQQQALQPLPQALPQAALQAASPGPLPTPAKTSPQPQAVAPNKDDKSNLASAPDAAIDVDLDAPVPEAVDGAKPRQKAQGLESRDQAPAGGKAFEAARDAAPARSTRAGESEGADASTTRHVAVRNVSTATHFPVMADPVRQIANEVTRALEAPAPTAPAEPQASPVKTVSIQLQPESLGTVTLRMRLSGDSLSVRVDVAEPATLELISRERDRLQKTMATDSVSIDRLEIRAAHEAAPVTAGDNANAPKQDMNAPGQQSRQNTTQQGGEQRRDNRGDSQSRPAPRNGFENDSARSDDPRGVYL